jgi:Mg2+ and Co2+ transporter CorA
MSQATPALKEAMAAVERLSARQQRQLATRLLERAGNDEDTFILFLKRLSHQKQERLAALMEKNNEGRLKKEEREELRRLKDEVDQLVLENSIALAHALRPGMPRKAAAPAGGRSRRASKRLKSD